MSIFELLSSLNINEFTAPNPEELQNRIKEIQACKQEMCDQSQIEDYRIDSFSKYLQLKQEKGGVYVEFQ